VSAKQSLKLTYVIDADIEILPLVERERCSRCNTPQIVRTQTNVYGNVYIVGALGRMNAEDIQQRVIEV
jgi:hypothetical protein